jgi:hypothetical protein
MTADRMLDRLQNHLADAVRDILSPDRASTA